MRMLAMVVAFAVLGISATASATYNQGVVSGADCHPTHEGYNSSYIVRNYGMLYNNAGGSTDYSYSCALNIEWGGYFYPDTVYVYVYNASTTAGTSCQVWGVTSGGGGQYSSSQSTTANDGYDQISWTNPLGDTGSTTWYKGLQVKCDVYGGGSAITGIYREFTLH
jgi:hypothetical protein